MGEDGGAAAAERTMSEMLAGDIELLAAIFGKTPEEQAAEMGIEYAPSLGRRRKENRAERESMTKLQAAVLDAHRAVEREQRVALDRCKTDQQRRDCIRAYADYTRMLTEEVSQTHGTLASRSRSLLD